MLAVVLAAGLGRRLLPLTDGRPKPMLPVAGKPMLERVMGQLAAEGVGTFVVVTHPDDELLSSYLEASPWRARVHVAYQETRQGMADAVACAAGQVRSQSVEEFLLSSCDNLFPAGHVAALVKARRARGLDAALTLMRVRPDEVPTLAIVQVEGERVTEIVEKPPLEMAPSDLGSVALYACSLRILDHLERVPLSERGEREFPDALRLLIEDGGAVGGLLVPSRMTLTTPPDLVTLNRRFLRADPACATVAADVPRSVTIVPPVRIEAGSRVGPGCCIGPEVYLESGCSVGRGATVRKAVVLRGAVVASGATVQGTVVCP